MHCPASLLLSRNDGKRCQKTQIRTLDLELLFRTTHLMEGLQDLRDRSYLNLAMPWLLILLLLVSLFRFCDKGGESDGCRHAPDLRDEPDFDFVIWNCEDVQVVIML